MADEVKTTSRKNAHDITIHDNKLYLLTVKEVCSANHHLEQEADYGRPYIYSNGKFNKADQPDSLTYEQYTAKSEEPFCCIPQYRTDGNGFL